MKRKLLLVYLLAMLMMPLFAGTTVDAAEDTFAEGLTIRHEFENASIVIETFYKTDYHLGYWRITDNKNVDISMRILEQPENTTVMIEHMHADCIIFANQSQTINGLTQDSMDDKMHVGEQEGFYISPEYNYNCVFAIEGYAEIFTRNWGFICGSYGTISSSRERLTESNLIYHGAEGSEFMVVFDLLIKNDGEEYFHTISFMDDFVVFFNGAFIENLGGVLEPPAEPEQISLTVILLGVLGTICICGILYVVLK